MAANPQKKMPGAMVAAIGTGLSFNPLIGNWTMSKILSHACFRNSQSVSTLPLFAWAERQRQSITEPSAMAGFLVRHWNCSPALAKALCEARGLNSEVFA